MTSIQTTEDFLRALTDDPAFRTAVREALMPEDDATMLGLMAAILHELREMHGIQREMLGTQKEMLGTERETLRTQEEMPGTLEGIRISLGHLVEDSLEWRMGYAVPSELRTGYGVRDMSVLVYPPREEAVIPDFLDELNAALELGTITEDERERVLSADMIIAELGDDGGWTRFFAVEASSSINNEVLDRAVRTVEILERVRGLPVVPVAFGHGSEDDARRYNDQEGRRRVRIIMLDGS